MKLDSNVSEMVAGSTLRKGYVSPKLTSLGRVSHLTMGNGTLCDDGQSGGQGNQSCA